MSWSCSIIYYPILHTVPLTHCTLLHTYTHSHTHTAGAAVCTSVAAGYYTATEGSPSVDTCAQGSYSTGGASVCTTCNAGYNCVAGSTSPTPISGACLIGTYCLDSITATDCPLGTYGIRAAARSSSHGCTQCEPGYYCPVLGGQIADRVLCPVGSYCPMGSSVITNCPGGFMSTGQGHVSIGACKPCGTGVYCPQGSSYESSCPAHHYCPAETTSFGSYPCPAGTSMCVYVHMCLYVCMCLWLPLVLRKLLSLAPTHVRQVRPVCIRVYVCVCMYICVRVCICVCMCAYVSVCVSVPHNHHTTIILTNNNLSITCTYRPTYRPTY